VDVNEAAPRRAGWLERLSPLGGIVFAVWLLVGFFTSGETGETAQSIVAYSESHETNLVFMQILAIATPILIGWTLAGLVARMRSTDTVLRALTLVGGAVFITLFATAFTIWNAPLLDESLTVENAATYLLLDDFGWILLGIGGVGLGVAIVAVSIAALRDRWVPKWVAWVSLALGLLAFLSVMGIGLFAYVGWLLVAGLLLLVRPRRDVAVA
jgi:hypothetical protein